MLIQILFEVMLWLLIGSGEGANRPWWARVAIVLVIILVAVAGIYVLLLCTASASDLAGGAAGHPF